MKNILFKCICTFLLAIFLTSCEKQEILETTNETANSSNYQNRALPPSPNIFLVSKTEITDNYRVNTSFHFPVDTYNVNSLMKYNVKAYRIVYNTKNTSNPDNVNAPTITASGTILVPQLTNMPLPIVSYQHGTSFKDADVAAGGFKTALYQLASTGFVVLVPDYLGYNESTLTQHPYFINSCSTRNIRDMISAGQEFMRDFGLNSSGKLFLEGYSEGANVTVALLKSLEQNPLSGLSVIATSVSSGPYNLKSIFATLHYNYNLPNNYANNLIRAQAATFMSYMIYGFQRNILNSENNSLCFNFPYNQPTGIPEKLGGLYPESEVTNLFKYYFVLNDFNYGQVFTPTSINSYVTYPNTGFGKYLTDNTLTTVNWRPNSLLKLFCGNQDIVVPKTNTFQLKSKMDSLPHYYDNVSIETTDTDHSSNPAHMFPYSFVWFNNLK